MGSFVPTLGGMIQTDVGPIAGWTELDGLMTALLLTEEGEKRYVSILKIGLGPRLEGEKGEVVTIVEHDQVSQP